MIEDTKIKLENLHDRQRYIIHNYCNTVGCDNCMYNTFDDEIPCLSIKLENEILDIEMTEFKLEG